MNAGTGLTGIELYPRFSEGEYARRYRAIREAMEKDGLDAILVSGGRGSSEVHYLSNYLAQSPCWLFLPARRRAHRVPPFLQPSALRQGSVDRQRRSLVWARADSNFG